MEKENTKPENTAAAESTSTSESGTRIDFDKARSVWRREFVTIEDFFSTRLDLPSGPLQVPSLMLGMDSSAIKLVPYNDALGAQQTVLASLVKRGEIVISIKHHGPHPEESEALKFQCTHIQVAVGVENGVITINNPQDYQNGLFGNETYPMIFVKPVLPSGLSDAERVAYFDNVRTWLVIANTFTAFPGNYDGGDPLSCSTVEQINEFAIKLIDALLGDADARRWFEDPERKLYCAELAYTALNLGIHCPLNKGFLGEKFERVKQALEDKNFVAKNHNKYAALVDLTISPETLKPICDVIEPTGHSDQFSNRLAIVPFTSADLVAEYLQRSVPRKKMGEDLGAKVQQVVLEKILPELPKFLSLETPEERAEFEGLTKKTLEIVGKVHASYEEFRTELNPLLSKLAEFSIKNGIAYIPPHAFLVRATDAVSKGQNNGLIGWEYLAHGLHSSVLR
jgi:hypothetical protein